LQTGDRVRFDLNRRTANALVSDEEWAARKAAWKPPSLVSQTPWQALHRQFVGQLDTGGCLDFAVDYQRIDTTFGLPRDNH
jgi:dihydroxy-acid dehydratase